MNKSLMLLVSNAVTCEYRRDMVFMVYVIHVLDKVVLWVLSYSS